MDDAISRYRTASEENDPARLEALLTPDAELVSPISGRMVFRGTADLTVLFAAVYGTLRELHWTDEIGQGGVYMVRGEAKVGPFKLGDAMVFELADDGRIRRIRPHFRPWLGFTVFALLLGARMALHPAVIWRALRRA